MQEKWWYLRLGCCHFPKRRRLPILGSDSVMYASKESFTVWFSKRMRDRKRKVAWLTALTFTSRWRSGIKVHKGRAWCFTQVWRSRRIGRWITRVKNCDGQISALLREIWTSPKMSPTTSNFYTHLSPSVSTAVTQTVWILPLPLVRIPFTVRVPLHDLCSGACCEGDGTKESRCVGRRKTIYVY